MNSEEAKIVNLVPGGNVFSFFQKEREKIVKYLMGRYGLKMEDAEDCFQEGSLAVWKNIKEGKLTKENLSCSLSTYLTRCCCNHATHVLEAEMQKSDFESDEYHIDEEGEVVGAAQPTEDEEDDAAKNQLLGILMKIVPELPSPCDKILWGKYRDHIKDADLAKMIGYSNADSVKAKRAFCMKRLKERMYSLVKEAV